MKNDKHYYKVKKNVNLPEGVNRIVYRVWWMPLPSDPKEEK
jgi:hypothetical protein